MQMGLGSNFSPSPMTSMGKPKAPSSAPTWAGCLNLSPKPKSPWPSPRLHLHHQLASPPGYHPQRKVRPPAAPWRGEQWRRSGGIQQRLPPWWHPAEAAAMVASASACMTGAGDGASCFEQIKKKVPQSRKLITKWTVTVSNSALLSL